MSRTRCRVLRLTVAMARLFIAVWPTEEVAEELRTLHRKDQQGVRFVPPDNWHITLRFLGDVHADDVAEALAGAELPACRARLGPAVDVLNERALVVPVAGIDDLAHVVREHTARIGEPAPKRNVSSAPALMQRMASEAAALSTQPPET